MPYISSEDRPPIDKKVQALAGELSSKLMNEMNRDTELSLCYKESILTIAKLLHSMQQGDKENLQGREAELAQEIFNGAQRHGYRGAWLGALDYALTRLIQVVPAMMVDKGAWKEDFRFWIYAQTVGALQRAAITIHLEGKDDWVTDGLIGVVMDVKDEYKRRVNSAYEASQIVKSGDCYTTHYRTEVVEVKSEGKRIGYQEIMKDFSSKQDRD